MTYSELILIYFHNSNDIPSFECHSIIQMSFYLLKLFTVIPNSFGMGEFLFEWDWNDQMMVEWQVSLNSVFICLSKTPPFLLIPPFLSHLRRSRMRRNENHNGKISFKSHSRHFHFIPSSFVIQKWWEVMEWCEMNWYSWTKAKPLIFKFISFHHHSAMPS